LQEPAPLRAALAAVPLSVLSAAPPRREPGRPHDVLALRAADEAKADEARADEAKADEAKADDRLPILVLLGIPLAATAIGFPYYMLGPGERMRSSLHAWLKPTGTIGLEFGVAGLALFLFMWAYPLRKRYRWLGFTGAVGAWLRVHTLAGLALPFLVAVHAGWHFDGLIGLGYLAMVLVALSGVVGRYLYVRIPRSRTGLELTIDEAVTERRALITRIAAMAGLDPRLVEESLAVDARPDQGLGPLRTVWQMIADDFARARAIRRIGHEWARAGTHGAAAGKRALGQALRLARRELALAQQLRMLDATRRLFALWHVAHRPFAITALLAVLIHVVVAVAVGAVRWSIPWA